MTDEKLSKNPVEALRHIGRVEGDYDYMALGFNSSHLPELINLVKEQTCVVDDVEDVEDGDDEGEWTAELENAWFASIHAWIVLGQLKDIAAAPVLIAQLTLAISEDVDWAFSVLPLALASIGAEVYPLLQAELSSHPPSKDSADEEHGYQQQLLMSLSHVARGNEDLTQQAVALFSQELALACVEEGEDEDGDDEEEESEWAWRQEAYTYNTGLIECLVHLKAAESIDVIRAAYDADVIDTAWYGKIEEIEFLLGLGEEPIRPKNPFMDHLFASSGTGTGSFRGSLGHAVSKSGSADKKKKKAKKAKKSQQKKSKAKKKKRR